MELFVRIVLVVAPLVAALRAVLVVLVVAPLVAALRVVLAVLVVASLVEVRLPLHQASCWVVGSKVDR